MKGDDEGSKAGRWRRRPCWLAATLTSYDASPAPRPGRSTTQVVIGYQSETINTVTAGALSARWATSSVTWPAARPQHRQEVHGELGELFHRRADHRADAGRQHRHRLDGGLPAAHQRVAVAVARPTTAPRWSRSPATTCAARSTGIVVAARLQGGVRWPSSRARPCPPASVRRATAPWSRRWPGRSTRPPACNVENQRALRRRSLPAGPAASPRWPSSWTGRAARLQGPGQAALRRRRAERAHPARCRRPRRPSPSRTPPSSRRSCRRKLQATDYLHQHPLAAAEPVAKARPGCRPRWCTSTTGRTGGDLRT